MDFAKWRMCLTLESCVIASVRCVVFNFLQSNYSELIHILNMLVAAIPKILLNRRETFRPSFFWNLKCINSLRNTDSFHVNEFFMPLCEYQNCLPKSIYVMVLVLLNLFLILFHILLYFSCVAILLYLMYICT